MSFSCRFLSRTSPFILIYNNKKKRGKNKRFVSRSVVMFIFTKKNSPRKISHKTKIFNDKSSMNNRITINLTINDRKNVILMNLNEINVYNYYLTP